MTDTEYIITEWELNNLEKYGLNPDIEAFVRKIRSRPHLSPQDKTGQIRCQDCKSAKRKERVWWVCRKNCVERNCIDICIMNPVQFEPRNNEEVP